MIWEDGRLKEAVLRPGLDGQLEIRAEGVREILESGRKAETEKTAYGLRFAAEAGKIYTLQ